MVFVIAGINHFRHPAGFIRIVPPVFPAPGALVAVSGAAEMLGGLGLLIRRVRRPAGWGLIALVISVFPANVYMLQHDIPLGNTPIPRLLLWLRLPVQALLIWLVWWAAVAPGARRPGERVAGR